MHPSRKATHIPRASKQEGSAAQKVPLLTKGQWDTRHLHAYQLVPESKWTVGTLCSVNDGTEARAGRIIPSQAHRQQEAAELGLSWRPRGSQKSPGFSLPLPQSGIPSYSFLTSSGSESLNSQPSPVQLMKDWQDLSVSNSRRNCHSWIGPLPGSTRH